MGEDLVVFVWAQKWFMSNFEDVVFFLNFFGGWKCDFFVLFVKTLGNQRSKICRKSCPQNNLPQQLWVLHKRKEM